MTPMLEILLVCLVANSFSRGSWRGVLDRASRDADQILSAALNSSS